MAKRGTPGIRKGGLGYCRKDKASTPMRPLNPRVSEFEPAVVSIPPCSQPCSEPPSSPSPSWPFQVSPLHSPLPLHQSREAISAAEKLSRGRGGRPSGPSVWTGGMAPLTSSTARMSQPPPATISNNHQDTYNLGNDSKVDPILLGFNTLLFQGIMRRGRASAAMGGMQTSLHGSARKVALLTSETSLSCRLQPGPHHLRVPRGIRGVPTSWCQDPRPPPPLQSPKYVSAHHCGSLS